MDETKTLNEVCAAIHVSRRAVQGYEAAELVKASGRNKYGHLLYDAEAQNRIRRIRLLQQLGFRVKEIRTIIDAPNHVVKAAIETQIQILRSEMQKKEDVILQAEQMMKEL